MSWTFGDHSMFLCLRHPEQPGERVVFQYTRNKRIRVVRLLGTENNAETWELDPGTVGSSIHGQDLMTSPEAKEHIAELEGAGWVEANNDNILGTTPMAAGVSGAQMDSINRLPVVTRNELMMTDGES